MAVLLEQQEALTPRLASHAPSGAGPYLVPGQTGSMASTFSPGLPECGGNLGLVQEASAHSPGILC